MAESMPASQPGGETLDMGLLLRTLVAFKKGDFTARMPIDQVGVTGKIYDTLNDIIDLNELERTSIVVGKEGRTTQRATLSGALGGWAGGITFVNTLIADLAQPTNEVARVITAVANGDLS